LWSEIFFPLVCPVKIQPGNSKNSSVLRLLSPLFWQGGAIWSRKTGVLRLACRGWSGSAEKEQMVPVAPVEKIG
jgi:hypothetical protein